MLHDNTEPLRVSAYTLARALLATAMRGELRLLDRTKLDALNDRLRRISVHSTHPLLHARLAQVDTVLALADGDPARAAASAARQADIARGAGLLEPLCDALLLQAGAARAAAHAAGLDEATPAEVMWLQEAAALAQTQGLADAGWRALEWVAENRPEPACRLAAAQARQRLEGDAATSLFDAAAARQREPRLDTRSA